MLLRLGSSLLAPPGHFIEMSLVVTPQARGEDGAQENGTEKNDRGLDKLSADVAPAGTRQSQQERQHLDHEKQQGGDRLLFAECVDALAERLRAAS